MNDIGRLCAIEITVSNAERSRHGLTLGYKANGTLVPPILRALADWHVVEFKAPNDFSDSTIVRLVPR
jgi:hypothetical protein